MIQEKEELLTYDEACARLGISKGGLTNAISRGRLHPVKFPNSNRKYLKASEVAAYREKPDPRLTVDSVAPDAASVLAASMTDFVKDMAADMASDVRAAGTDTAMALIAGRVAILREALQGASMQAGALAEPQPSAQELVKALFNEIQGGILNSAQALVNLAIAAREGRATPETFDAFRSALLSVASGLPSDVQRMLADMVEPSIQAMIEKTIAEGKYVVSAMPGE